MSVGFRAEWAMKIRALHKLGKHSTKGFMVPLQP